MRVDIFHHFSPDSEVLARLDLILDKLEPITENTENIMIDTSRIIAAVAAEKTKVDSLITLANGQSATMKDLSAQLAAAIAANDPAALAQVQADLDKASSDLDTETAAVTAAIDANTPPGPTP